ncbi:MAG: sulfite reductase subunit alpha [Planctomycetales bacterium]|nr:sulfite reductase subunit alpha [Planctomycetales bacterium]
MSVSLIPDSAPFSEEQRAWLNGFLSGFLGVLPNESEARQMAAANSPTAAPTAALTAEQPMEAEDLNLAPWHDSALPLEERLQLADGRPLAHRLMAAMAQLDCGSCGYLCQTYSAAIASGEESSLSLCSPGGKETKQALKQLVKEIELPLRANKLAGTNGSAKANGQPQYSRKNPFPAKLLESRCLNKPGSAKDTRHVVIDLAGSGLEYAVGDALGVWPRNCATLVRSIIQHLGVDGQMLIQGPSGPEPAPLAQVLTTACCLKEPSDALLKLIAERTKQSETAAQLAEYMDTGVPEGFDVLDCLELDQSVRISATEFMETLETLNPRLYSIASSQRRVGDRVELTVGKVVYERQGRKRKGVASCMLGGDLEPGAEVRVFIQPNHGGFTVPPDPALPMVMIGPGTGIAPFMAFLNERAAVSAAGKNWLFFGDQHAACDFLYEDELQQFCESGLLSRLDTAFSRDSDKKVYVQDRMRENGQELWNWIQAGAHIYVCGDASRMAADVHRALQDVFSMAGGLAPDEAAGMLDTLAQQKRYVRDVY